MQPNSLSISNTGSEGKHILCLISHLLSGWIHSFSKMPCGDNKGFVRGREERVYVGGWVGGGGVYSTVFTGRTLLVSAGWVEAGLSENVCSVYVVSHVLKVCSPCCSLLTSTCAGDIR